MKKTILSQTSTQSNSSGDRFEIVGRVAYLTGVAEKKFREDCCPYNDSLYNLMDKDKDCRIIRNLCILRNDIMINITRVWNTIRFKQRTIMNMPEYVNQEAMKALYDDGINIYTHMDDANEFLTLLNMNIANRIGNCVGCFPEWIKWDYLKDMFIMPGWSKISKVRAEVRKFHTNINNYPFNRYINRPDPKEEMGNIWYNDLKFVSLLYKWHKDEFKDLNLLRDVSDHVRSNIHDFINDSKKCLIIVDCENSDPYRLCAALNGLDKACLDKISKIVLYDDVNASSAWEILERFVKVPVEREVADRLKDDKSLTDMLIATRVSREFYSEDTESFILVSSDSDYWAVISSLPKARFLMMVEHEKCSPKLKDALRENDMCYCYIDDFYGEEADRMKNVTIKESIQGYLDGLLELNINNMMDSILRVSRIHMTDSEKDRFIKKEIRKKLHLNISENGDTVLVYGD